LGKALDKLHSPNLEKALPFLDEKLLPATSNAVECENRRYRKMQKTVNFFLFPKENSAQGSTGIDLGRVSATPIRPSRQSKKQPKLERPLICKLKHAKVFVRGLSWSHSRHFLCGCPHRTGFEWGFAGSRPAQLALALAADVLGDD
jgi:hypothetical protein